MKFTINGKILKTALDKVRRVVETKTTIPILSHVLITAQGNIVTLTGSDLDQFMVVPFSTHMELAGHLCVDAKQLSEMTKTLTGPITFEYDKETDRLILTSGSIVVRMEIAPADQFPIIPVIDKPSELTLTGDILRSMVKNTMFATTKEESRFTISGGKLESSSKGTKLVATDGHRLSYTQCHFKGKIDALVSRTGWIEAAKMAGDTVNISSDLNHVKFESDDCVLISRKLTGTFPNYEMVMPQDNDKSLTFDIDTLKDAVKRASASADKRNAAFTVSLRTNSAIITTNAEGCERSETVGVSYAGEDMELGFNWKYLLEYLTVASPGLGKMSFKDPNAQVEFTIDGYAYDFRYIVMPLRV